MAEALDITKPNMPVEIKVSNRGVVWVNVGPVCVLRICQTGELTVHDERHHMPPDSLHIMSDEEFAAETKRYQDMGWPDLAPCCKQEERGWGGGCKNCGDPPL